MEAKVIELVVAKCLPMFTANAVNGYRKHVEKEVNKQTENGKTKREALVVTNNIASNMERELVTMEKLSEHKDYETYYTSSEASTAKIEIIKTSDDMSTVEKVDKLDEIYMEERVAKREAAKSAEQKELLRLGGHVVQISIIGAFAITALKIVFGVGGGVTSSQNFSGSERTSISYNEKKCISGAKYNAPRIVGN